MRFTKMHGLGNDFVIFNRAGDVALVEAARLARRLCDRRRGIGADGLIFVLPSRKADVRMRIFNADGSEAEMCGNGIRCLARFVAEEGLSRKKELTVETLAGIKCVTLRGSQITVDMGKPAIAPNCIPVRSRKNCIVEEKFFLSSGTKRYRPSLNLNSMDRRALADLATGLQQLPKGLWARITCVSMGNPHCVLFVSDVKGFPVAVFGPLIEHHPAFPARTNVEFVEVLSRTRVVQRTWERGVGETDACGTGACAAAYAAFLTGRTGRRVTVVLPGGRLQISVEDDGRILMTGGAETVFKGEIR